MRTLILILAAICLIVGPAPVPAQVPSTAPSTPPPIVLIFPFQPIGQVTGHEWVGPSLLENMLADVNKSGLVQTRAMPSPLPVSDAAKAVASGKTLGAAMVIFGSYQIIGDQIRVTGQVAEIPSGNVVSSPQATGTVTDIFRVEDKLAAQLTTPFAQQFAPQQSRPLVLFGVQTDIYASSNAVVRPLPSGQIQPEFFSGPTAGYVPNYPYAYAPGNVLSSGIFLGNRLDYGYYDSYSRNYGRESYYGGYRRDLSYDGSGGRQRYRR